jgi:ferredoxin
MGKIKIIYDPDKCIGAGVCESLSPRFWKIKDSKAVLKGCAMENKKCELIIDASEEDIQKQVAQSCPSGAIKVSK